MSIARNMMQAASNTGGGASGGEGLTFLGQVTAVSTTDNPTYTSFSADFNGLQSESNALIVAVIQSRNSSGDAVSPYSAVIINGTTAVLRNRGYTGGNSDFNSCCIAYIIGPITTSVSVNVTLGEVHEGQANVFLYKLVDPSGFPNNYANSSNAANAASSISASVTTASSVIRPAIVIAVTSNSPTAWSIASSAGVVTEDFVKDGGTTEWVTVASVREMPASTSVTFQASGAAATGDVAIQVFAMDS